MSRYAAFDPSKGPNRPHISSVTSDFKERGRQNQPAASSIAMTRPPACSRFLFRLPGVSAVSVHRCSVVRFGEAVFTDGGWGPQELFYRKMSFFYQTRFLAQNLGVSERMATKCSYFAQEDFPNFPRQARIRGLFHRLGHSETVVRRCSPPAEVRFRPTRCLNRDPIHQGDLTAA